MNKSTLHERTIRVGQLCKSNRITVQRFETETEKLAQGIAKDMLAIVSITFLAFAIVTWSFV